MRAVKGIVATVGVIWAVLVFSTSVSPDEARSRTLAWLNLPVIRSIPDWIVGIASSRWTLAITALVIGLVLGWIGRGRADSVPALNPWRSLAVRVSNLAYAMDNQSFMGVRNDVLSEYDVVRGKLRQAGIDPPPGGILNREEASRYLHQVSRYLNEGDYEIAKAYAARAVAEWGKSEQATGTFR